MFIECSEFPWEIRRVEIENSRIGRVNESTEIFPLSDKPENFPKNSKCDNSLFFSLGKRSLSEARNRMIYFVFKLLRTGLVDSKCCEFLIYLFAGFSAYWLL